MSRPDDRPLILDLLQQAATGGHTLGGGKLTAEARLKVAGWMYAIAPDTRALCVVLARTQGMPWSEVGAVLGITRQAGKSAYDKGLAALRYHVELSERWAQGPTTAREHIPLPPDDSAHIAARVAAMTPEELIAYVPPILL